MSGYDLSPAVRLEERIDAAGAEGLRGRWEFGRWMLGHVPEGKKKLPDGFLPALEQATGKSRSELQYRRQFAEDFDEGALSKALDNRRSWHEIVNDLLVRDPIDVETGGFQGEEWQVPLDLLHDLAEEFDFDLELAELTDPLREIWRGVCWLVPPPGVVLEPWVAKACRSAEDDKATTIVCLLPARTDAEWWWENCVRGTAEVRFLYPRPEGAPYACAVVIFGRKARVRWWDRSEAAVRAGTRADRKVAA